ncbi:MAG: hypothetical protein II565_11795 [Fibrobacter sp.]|nr:hypothetical protein [Fibrobacter sp.]
MLNAIISASAAIVGVLIGVFSTHLLRYIDRKSEERKIINESIHYLLELYFLVNRLNSEKMLDAYLDYYFQELKKLIPAIDEKTIESAKAQYCPQLKNFVIPISQKHSFEKLEKMDGDYKSMLDKLVTILPIDAYYLRGKNNLKSLLDLLAEYFEGVKSSDLDNQEIVGRIVEQMQSIITKTVVTEYTDDLKKELFVLLKKTDRYNRKTGKKAINSIEATILTEKEKREVKSYIIGVFNLFFPNATTPVN